MSIYKRVYERSVARLLSHHAEQGIPAETDLWPQIEERLQSRVARPTQQSEHLASTNDKAPHRVPSPQINQKGRILVPQTAARSRSYRGSAMAMLGILILAGLSWLALWSVAQRQDRRQEQKPVLNYATSLPAQGPQPSGDTTRMFSIPVSEKGLHYVGTTISGFFAAAPDGTFWAGSNDARLLHYTAEGKQLGEIQIPYNGGYPRDMLAGDTDLWLLYTSEPDGPAVVYKVALDGHKVAEYPIPGYLEGALSGLMLGEQGEVLLKGPFYYVEAAQVSPATLTARIPQPVPSVFPPAFPDPLWQLVDSQGNLEPKALDGYTSAGKLYFARPPYAGTQTPRLFIKAGDLETTIVLSHTLLSADMLTVEPDGSFHVLVEEQDEGSSPVIGLERTIMHFRADGQLLERARVPLMAAKVIPGPGGQFYVLMENPDRAQRGDALPNSVEVHHLNFYSASQPLPATATLLPVSTAAPTPPATSRAAVDLNELIRKSDIIVYVRVFGYNQEGQDVVLSMEVQQWFKAPNGAPTNVPGTGGNTLQLYIPAALWAAMPQAFRANTEPTRESRYVMFLNKGITSPTFGETYSLTDGPDGAFYVNAGHIQGTVPGKYDGMSVDDFRRLITGEPTPVPTIPMQNTPTRVPNSAPLSIVPEGDGFRVDVYEGSARFGSTVQSPWVGPSRLLLEWASAPSAPTDVYSFSTYMVDTAGGKLIKLPVDVPNRNMFLSPDGNRAVMVWQSGSLRVALYDFRSGELQTVADIDPAVPQWAGPETGIADFKAGTEIFVNAVPVWAGDNAFAFTLTLRTEAGEAYSRDKALFVDTVRKQVRVLAEQGTVVAAWPDGSVLLRSGKVDGEVLLFRQGEKSPGVITPSGLWKSSWSVSPDGKQVAWLEMAPPPGDGTKNPPDSCCSGDAPQTVKGIAVWDVVTGKVQRFDTPNFAWPSPDVSWSQAGNLVWSKDSAALFYATHPSQDHTSLMRLTLDGKSMPLVEMDKRVGMLVVAEGSDGSVYYSFDGMDCQNCAQLMRRHADGKLEVVHANSVPMDWHVDEHGHLEVLKDGGVSVMDLNTGWSGQVSFPGERISGSEMGWSHVGSLVPVSPDGTWAAYAGSQSDAIAAGPDGRPDRGTTVHIRRLK